MQLFALFAILPLLANAVPLNLGGVQVLPLAPIPAVIKPTSGNLVDVGAGVNVDLGLGVNLGNPLAVGCQGAGCTWTTTTAAAPATTPTGVNVGANVDADVNVDLGLGGTGGCQGSGCTWTTPAAPPASPTTTANLVNVGADVGATVAVGLGTGAVALPTTGSVPNVPSVPIDVPVIPAVIPAVLPAVNSIVTALPAVVTNLPGQVLGGLGGVVSGATTPILTAPPSILNQLNTFISGLKAPSVLVAIGQLNALSTQLTSACSDQANALKSTVDVQKLVASIVQLLKNINTYLVSLPNWIATNGTVKQGASAVDDLLSAYILGLKIIGISTATFVQEAYKAGMESPTNYSPLLVKTCALFK